MRVTERRVLIGGPKVESIVGNQRVPSIKEHSFSGVLLVHTEKTE